MTSEVMVLVLCRTLGPGLFGQRAVRPLGPPNPTSPPTRPGRPLSYFDHLAALPGYFAS
jgi:hypothetical protein